MARYADPGGGRPSGLGLAFNPALADFVTAHRGALDYLEISPERFWHDRGPALKQSAGRYCEIPEAVAQLEAARGDLPLVAHGVGLSIATDGPLDRGHIEQMARWRDRYGFAWFSEHLAWFRLGPQDGWRGVGTMLPPVYDAETLEDLVPKLQTVCAVLGIEVLVENAVDYTPVAQAGCSEAAFLTRLTERTPARLLLDLHNLYTNAVNHGAEAADLVGALDLRRVHELHIAGGEPLHGFWTDSHSGRCPEPVWMLLEQALRRPNAVRAITFEIDESYVARLGPAALLEQLGRARSIWRATRPECVVPA